MKRYQVTYKAFGGKQQCIITAEDFFINSHGDLEFKSPCIAIQHNCWESVEELPELEENKDIPEFEGQLM